MLDCRFTRAHGPYDGHYIESRRILQQSLRFQISKRRLSHAALLIGIDRFRRITGIARCARFNFDKYNRAIVDGNDIDFTQRRIVPALDDSQAVSFQKTSRGVLTALTERFRATESLKQPSSYTGCDRHIRRSELFVATIAATFLEPHRFTHAIA
jgi:hypothetical protein